MGIGKPTFRLDIGHKIPITDFEWKPLPSLLQLSPDRPRHTS